MNLQQGLMTIVMVSSILLTPLSVYAQTASPVSKGNETAKINTLRTACDNAISQRLTSLNDMNTKINSLIKLSAADKTKYTGQISTDIAGLNAQKVKCDADTDATTLKTDYRNVYLQFRIYAVFLPQTRLLTASDTMGVTSDQLADLYTKLQSRVQAAGNPSNLTSLLADMQTKINDSKTQYSNVESLVTPLTPNSFNTDPTGTRTTLTSARNDIKTGAADLKTADSDAKQIYQTLKSSNPSASPVVSTNP